MTKEYVTYMDGLARQSQIIQQRVLLAITELTAIAEASMYGNTDEFDDAWRRLQDQLAAISQAERYARQLTDEADQQHKEDYKAGRI